MKKYSSQIDGRIDCKSIREDRIQELKEKVANIKDTIRAVFIQVGDNPASEVYVRNKVKLCEEVGIDVTHEHLPVETTEEKLLDLIRWYNNNGLFHGIMVQLPLPAHIREEKVINAINPVKDIDGFTHMNKGKLMTGEDGLVACTPQGIMTILDAIEVNPKGKLAVIVGRSNIVGKPMAQLLINAGATVLVCNSNTNERLMYTAIAESDIFISAIGKANYFDFKKLAKYNIDNSNKSMRKGIAIDVGINRNEEGKLCGDIDHSVYDFFEMYTPVPSGVGLTTVLTVIANVVRCYELQQL